MESEAIMSQKKTTEIFHSPKNGFSLWKRIKENKALLLMFTPGFLLILVFAYGPMYGLILAFKDYNMGLGIMGSSWVGLKHFRDLFSNQGALIALKNTFIISFLKLLFGFPAPIFLAILLNEVRQGTFKKIVQTVSYFPHFISWVVVAGIMNSLLSPSTGSVNYVIKFFSGEPIFFMSDVKWFRPMLIISNIWKEIGWGSVIYLAALSSVPIELHEAAVIDGASRLQRVRYITLPSLKSIMVIMLLLQMGNIMSAGFDQIFNLYNPTVYSVSDIIDTYVYRIGIGQMMYSFNTAVGLFKSVVSFALILMVNYLTKRLSDGDTGIF